MEEAVDALAKVGGLQVGYRISAVRKELMVDTRPDCGSGEGTMPRCCRQKLRSWRW